MSNEWGLFILALIIIAVINIYFLPIIVAQGRNLKNSNTILVVNIFLGWTLIGWVVALAWSFSGTVEKYDNAEAQFSIRKSLAFRLLMRISIGLIILFTIASAIIFLKSLNPDHPVISSLPVPITESGSDNLHPEMSPKVLAACLLFAAHTYQVPPQALIAIMHVEDGHIGQTVGPKKDGSYNLGPMQINTRWVPRLASIWGTDNVTAMLRVRDNGCVNVHVGAWILRQRINETGNLYRGIAAYHSYNPVKGATYLQNVIVALRRLGFLTEDNKPINDDHAKALDNINPNGPSFDEIKKSLDNMDFQSMHNVGDNLAKTTDSGDSQ